MEMTPTEIVLSAGVAVTLVLGIANLVYNLRTSKRAAFVNTVTSERIKWISKVRENISVLCALCNQWLLHRPQDATELLRKIEQLKSEIRLQLNPNDPEDRDIERLLGRLPSWTQSMTPEEYWTLQNALITSTQTLLKREWDKVKDESTKGDLRSRKI